MQMRSFLRRSVFLWMTGVAVSSSVGCSGEVPESLEEVEQADLVNPPVADFRKEVMDNHGVYKGLEGLDQGLTGSQLAESRPSKDELIRDLLSSDGIALVRCLGKNSRYSTEPNSADTERIVTSYDLEIVEVIRGRTAAYVVVPGGRVGDEQVLDYGSPILAPGKIYLAAFRSVGPADLRLTWVDTLTDRGQVTIYGETMSMTRVRQIIGMSGVVQ